MYSIKHYVIKFVSGFLRPLPFPPSLKLTATIKWNIVESGVKHHNPNSNPLNQCSLRSIFVFRIDKCCLIQVKWTKISYIDTLCKVWFIQDSVDSEVNLDRFDYSEVNLDRFDCTNDWRLQHKAVTCGYKTSKQSAPRLSMQLLVSELTVVLLKFNIICKYNTIVSSNPAHCEVYSIQHYVKVCQWLLAGQWFSPGTPVSTTNKTVRPLWYLKNQRKTFQWGNITWMKIWWKWVRNVLKITIFMYVHLFRILTK